MADAADWSQVLHDALGTDAEGGFTARPSSILQNTWVELSASHWEEGQGASPWNYAMPGGDWNYVTFYRKRTSPSPGGRGQSYKFQVFRGFIRFYVRGRVLLGVAGHEREHGHTGEHPRRPAVMARPAGPECHSDRHFQVGGEQRVERLHGVRLL